MIEGVDNLLQVHIILLVDLVGNFISGISVKLLIMIDQVGLDSRNGCVLANLNVNELIWDDSHGLKRESLDLGPWESLDDPTLTLLLI